MNQERVKGKVLPFHAKTCSSDQMAGGACCIIGSTDTCVDGPTSRKQPGSESNGTKIQVTMNLEPWGEEVWKSSRIGADDGAASDTLGTGEPSPKKQGVTVEEIRWLLSNPFVESSSPDTEGTHDNTVSVTTSEEITSRQGAGKLTTLQQFRESKHVQYPVLDKILQRFAVVASKRISGATGISSIVEPVSSVHTAFDVWQNMERPVMSTFSMYPQQGTGLIGIEGLFASALLHSLFGAGEYSDDICILEDISPDTCSPIGDGAIRHLLHLLLLDLEWALAPYLEVECFHNGPMDNATYQQNVTLDDSCILCEFSIRLVGAGTGDPCGTMMIVLPDRMIAGIENILTGEQEVLVPELEEIDDNALQHFRLQSDEYVLNELTAQPPLSAAVILSQLPEERRKSLVAAMDEERQEAITRRMGHRAGVEKVLTEAQQVVASILALGEAHAAQVVRSFSLEAAAGFLQEAAKLPSLYPEQVLDLLKQKNSSIVSAGPLIVDNALVRRIMIRAIAPEDMGKIVSLCRNEQVHMPFTPLLRKPEEDVARVLRKEPVAICRAIILYLLKADREYARSLLQKLPNSKELREQLRVKRSIAPDFVTVLEHGVVLQLFECAEDDLLASPRQERQAVSGTVEWLLGN